MTLSNRVDRWNHVDVGVSMTTSISTDDYCVSIKRTIEADGKQTEATIHVLRGSELDRLIAALERARAHRPQNVDV